MIVPLSRPVPFAAAGEAQLAELRALLARLGYTQAAAWARMGCEPVGVYRNPVDDGRDPMQLNDALDACIRLFMDGEGLSRPILSDLMGAEALALLAAIGLVESVPGDDAMLRATVQLYPTQDLYVVSDRHFDGRVSSEVVTNDVVYPAITYTVARYLELLPRRPIGPMLEVCGGTGIAALALSPTATRVWSSDITQRSTEFARFNARLNAIDNLTAVAGDMYEPVAGLRFDLIAAHPPYVPSLERKLIFRDGGAAGEEITQRVVEGAPAHLTPGGRLYCTCMGSERVNAPFEQRVREWLGEAGADCDVFFFLVQSHDPLVYYARAAASRRIGFDKIYEHLLPLKELGVRELLYGTIVIRRHGEARSALTLRQEIHGEVTWRDVDWYVDFTTMMAQPDAPERLLAMKPSTRDGVALAVRHTKELGEWGPTGSAVLSTGPFAAEMSGHAWLAALLARCDGERTVRDHWQSLRDASAIAPDWAPEELAAMVRTMIVGEILDVADAPRPERNRPSGDA